MPPVNDDTPGAARPCPQIDTAVAHSARIWNYWLGGKDNYAADRQAGDAYAQVFPRITYLARSSRYFLARAVAHLAADAGIRQFLDVGTGLPTVDNTHQVAQRIAPDSKIVYVDNDPLVLAHARALLTSSPQGRCEYVDADLREPGKILHAASKVLDFRQPVALLLMGIMGHIGDEHAHLIVAELVAGLPPGSYLGLYDGANVSEAFNAAQDGYNQTGAAPYSLRSPERIAAFFDGLDLVEPGVVPCTWWRPDHSPFGPPDRVETYGGLGRKPAATSSRQSRDA
jgi:O-methyltransferase involved in polyketide biosynthesis